MIKRPAARILVLDPQSKVLLLNYSYKSGRLKNKPFWTTPGGAVDPGESWNDAACRELKEETGLSGDLGPVVAIRRAPLMSAAGPVLADERYYILKLEKEMELSKAEWTVSEKESIQQFRWWTLEEVENSEENIWPRVLGQILRSKPSEQPLKIESATESLGSDTLVVDYSL